MIIYFSGMLASLVLAQVAFGCKSGKVVVLNRGSQRTLNLVRGLLIIISASPLIVISALRENVGTDFSGYVELFEKISNGERTYVEYGYFLLNKLAIFFDTNYRGVFILSSMVVGLFIYLAIFNLSENILLSVILYVITINYFNSLNIVRQYIGLAIFLFGLKYIKEKKFLKYLVNILIASLFHKSLLLGIIVYFFQYIKLSMKQTVTLLAIASVVLPWIKRIIWEIFSSTYYKIYLSDRYLNSFSVTYACINTFILLLAFYFHHQLKSKRMYRVFFNIHVCSMLVTIYSSIIPLSYRILWSLSLTNILFIPMLLQCIKKGKNKLLVQALVIFIYMAFTILTVGIKTYNDVLPYNSIISSWLGAH